MDVDRIKAAINGAWAFCEEQQWFENHKQYFTAHYLASGNPRGQSGHGGDEARYRYTQEMILDALDGDGSLFPASYDFCDSLKHASIGYA